MYDLCHINKVWLIKESCADLCCSLYSYLFLSFLNIVLLCSVYLCSAASQNFPQRDNKAVNWSVPYPASRPTSLCTNAMTPIPVASRPFLNHERNPAKQSKPEINSWHITAESQSQSHCLYAYNERITALKIACVSQFHTTDYFLARFELIIKSVFTLETYTQKHFSWYWYVLLFHDVPHRGHLGAPHSCNTVKQTADVDVRQLKDDVGEEYKMFRTIFFNLCKVEFAAEFQGCSLMSMSKLFPVITKVHSLLR